LATTQQISHPPPILSPLIPIHPNPILDLRLDHMNNPDSSNSKAELPIAAAKKGMKLAPWIREAVEEKIERES
jgi:hypothetical protein